MHARPSNRIAHGHHFYRAYFRNAILKQYEKFSTFLRNELCSNNLRDFGLRKSLDNLDAVRSTFQTLTSRFAGFQAQWLNVHVDFRCCSGSLCRSPLAPCAIPASKSTTPHHPSARSPAELTSAVDRPANPPCSPDQPSISPTATAA
jgi:hypothetical protein